MGEGLPPPPLQLEEIGDPHDGRRNRAAPDMRVHDEVGFDGGVGHHAGENMTAPIAIALVDEDRVFLIAVHNFFWFAVLVVSNVGQIIRMGWCCQ